SLVSTEIPGPIVEETVNDTRYCPFAAGGLALIKAEHRASMFSLRRCPSNDSLPTPALHTPARSALNSIFPLRNSAIVLVTSMVTVPALGVGIRFLGPRTFPNFPTSRIISGVATATSKSTQPPLIFSTRSSPPTKSAPASKASL
ncbi:hypothetical protein CP082626L3_0958B, partial [Chlamydia psittaci 08-2626_L3]